MAARRVLTRAETQARTREELIDAAEELFLGNGYHSTSIAAIAAEAGRTVGAVYSNFANKEDLCLEVLKRRASGEMSSLMAGLAASSEYDTDALMDGVAAWWTSVSANTNVVILISEYLLSILREVDRRTEMNDTVDRLVESAAVLLDEYRPEGGSSSYAATRVAARAVISTGAGLAAGQAAGMIGVEESVSMLTTTIRLWMGHINESVG